MNKNIIPLLIIALFIQIPQLFAKEKTIISLYGKIDPRLYVSARTSYRSMDPNDIRENFEECTQYSSGTNQRRRTLDYDIKFINPNKDGEYKLDIPIDYYEEKNPCGYEYVATELRIKRHKDDDFYVEMYILSTNKILTNRRGKISGSGWAGVRGFQTNKKYLQVASGSKIDCYTEHYISKDRKTKLFEESTSFICEPVDDNNDNGVDEFKTTSINLDILINKNKSTILDQRIPKIGTISRIKPYHFIEYKKPPTFFEKVKLYIKNLIN